MRFVHHTPPWGDVIFLRLLEGGLKQMRVMALRHSAETQNGGTLDVSRMREELRQEMWTAIGAACGGSQAAHS